MACGVLMTSLESRARPAGSQAGSRGFPRLYRLDRGGAWELNPTEPYPRDLIGYGSQPPQAHWPDDARVAVSIVLNYEEGGEILHPCTATPIPSMC